MRAMTVVEARGLGKVYAGKAAVDDLPFNAGGRIVNQFTEATSVFGQPLSLVGALLILGGLAVAGMAASLALFHRRDA